MYILWVVDIYVIRNVCVMIFEYNLMELNFFYNSLKCLLLFFIWAILKCMDICIYIYIYIYLGLGALQFTYLTTTHNTYMDI